VDVPNATLMVIEEADRFGLSQMHQLRGRVGRGTAQSYCILISDSQKAETRERLKALCATNDGFKIAEDDLRLRGPGDVLGNRQHGLPQFKVANLEMDMETLQEAQYASRSIQWDKALKDPVYKPLMERIEHLFEKDKIGLN
jgi:ATP-dependent DNA helicase RecG